MAITGL